MRFRLITLFLAVVLAGGISAQQKDKIVMAEYPGGQKELQKYLEENIVTNIPYNSPIWIELCDDILE